LPTLVNAPAAADELLARQKEGEKPEGRRTQEGDGREHDRSFSGVSSLEVIHHWNSSLEELWWGGRLPTSVAVALSPLRLSRDYVRIQRHEVLATTFTRGMKHAGSKCACLFEQMSSWQNSSEVTTLCTTSEEQHMDSMIMKTLSEIEHAGCMAAV
jgi:hypothetical protein